MKLTVVIPVFNEAKTVVEAVELVRKTPYDKEILVVDDGSTDGTRQALARYEGDDVVQVLLLPYNRGKGAALREGFVRATGDVVIVQDADLEYSPDDYPKLLEPIVAGHADVVYGSRFQGGSGRVLYYRHALANRLLTSLSNLLTDLNLTDMETCFKVFKREVIQNIVLESDRFGFEPEVTAKIAKMPGVVVYEVAVQYHGRTYGEGKKITWRDGVAALWHVARFNLASPRSRAYRADPATLSTLVRNQRGRRQD